MYIDILFYSFIVFHRYVGLHIVLSTDIWHQVLLIISLAVTNNRSLIYHVRRVKALPS